MIGTSSNGSSTPEVAARDHHARPRPSRIASKSSTAGRVSILATIGGAVGRQAGRAASATSSRRRTNDWRDEVDAELDARRGTSARSLSPSAAGVVSRSDGTFTPARDRIVPPRTTSVATTSPSMADDAQLDGAVGEQDAVARVGGPPPSAA